MGTFLDDLPGVRDLQWEDHPAVPRRSLITFLGAVTVVDNPARGSTDITINAPPPAVLTVPTVVGSGSIAELDPVLGGPNPELKYLWRFNISGPMQLHGLKTTARAQVMFVNRSTGFDLTIKHNSATCLNASSRFLCPNNADVVVGPGRCYEIVRDDVSERWLVAL